MNYCKIGFSPKNVAISLLKIIILAPIVSIYYLHIFICKKVKFYILQDFKNAYFVKFEFILFNVDFLQYVTPNLRLTQRYAFI